MEINTGRVWTVERQRLQELIDSEQEPLVPLGPSVEVSEASYC